MQATAFDRSSLDAHRGFMPLRARALDLSGHNCNYRICPHQPERKAFPCAPGFVWDFTHKARPVLRCGSWSCEYCGPGKASAFRAEARYFLRAHKFGRGRAEASFLVTLTWRGTCEVRCGQHWRACINAGHSKIVLGVRGRPLTHNSMEQYWRRWTVLMRRRFPGMAYLRVREYTRAGVPHYHLLLTGVGGDKDRVHSAAVADWFGITLTSYIVDVRRTYADVASYLSKYLSKGFEALPADVPPKARRYSFSLNACRQPLIVKRYVAVAYLARLAGYLSGDLTDFSWWFQNGGSHFRGARWCDADGDWIKPNPCGHRGCDMIGFVRKRNLDNLERELGISQAMRLFFGECEYGIDLDAELDLRQQGSL